MPAACRMFSAGAHVIERTANTNQLDVLHLKGICSTTDGPSGSGWRRRRRRALQMAERRTEFAARAPEIEKGGSTAREVASPRRRRRSALRSCARLDSRADADAAARHVRASRRIAAARRSLPEATLQQKRLRVCAVARRPAPAAARTRALALRIRINPNPNLNPLADGRARARSLHTSGSAHAHLMPDCRGAPLVEPSINSTRDEFDEIGLRCDGTGRNALRCARFVARN